MKIRTGVMSDSYIKATNPQYFPLDLGSELSSITLPTHNFSGIKQSLKCKNVSRRPIVDMANFANIATPANKEESEQKAIAQYKQLINNALSGDTGDKFMSENLETNFNGKMYSSMVRGKTINSIGSNPDEVQQIIMNVMETQTSVYDTDSPTISLKSYSRKRGADKVSHELGSSSRDMFSVRTRATLANIVDKNDYQSLVDKIYPFGYNPKMKLNDAQVLEELMKLYPEDTELIQNTYDRTLTNTNQRVFVRESVDDDNNDDDDNDNPPLETQEQ